MTRVMLSLKHSGMCAQHHLLRECQFWVLYTTYMFPLLTPNIPHGIGLEQRNNKGICTFCTLKTMKKSFDQVDGCKGAPGSTVTVQLHFIFGEVFDNIIITQMKSLLGKFTFLGSNELVKIFCIYFKHAAANLAINVPCS